MIERPFIHAANAFIETAQDNDPGEDVSAEVMGEYGARCAREAGIDDLADLNRTAEHMASVELTPHQLAVCCLIVGFRAGYGVGYNTDVQG